MKLLSLEQELSSNAYPGRGIVLGLTPDGTHAVAAYFIMGRSVNSRNRVFVEDGEGIRTQAFDPSKLSIQALSSTHLSAYLATKPSLPMATRPTPSMKAWISR